MRNADKIRKELIMASVTMFGYSIFDKTRARDSHVYHRQSIMYVLRKQYKYTLKVTGAICSTNPERITAHDIVHHHVGQVIKDMELKGTEQHRQRQESIELWKTVIAQAHNEDRRTDKSYQLLKRMALRLNSEDMVTLNQIFIRLGYLEK